MWARAADVAAAGPEETLSYYALPTKHWRSIWSPLALGMSSQEIEIAKTLDTTYFNDGARDESCLRSRTTKLLAYGVKRSTCLGWKAWRKVMQWTVSILARTSLKTRSGFANK